MTDELLDKFADVLKTALQLQLVSFPEDDTIKSDFAPLKPVYRVVRRDSNESLSIRIDDFWSHIERYKSGEKIKGVGSESERDIKYYSCSFFDNVKSLKRIMHLPKKNKYIIIGSINQENGVVKIDRESGHIHLWLFRNNMIFTQFSNYKDGDG